MLVFASGWHKPRRSRARNVGSGNPSRLAAAVRVRNSGVDGCMFAFLLTPMRSESTRVRHVVL